MRELFKKVLEVSAAIDEYSAIAGDDEADYATLSSFINDRVKDISKIDILEIIQFLQALAPNIIASADNEGWDTSDLNLESELNALYRRSKQSMINTADKDSLMMCVKAIDTIVRLKDKVQSHERVKQIEEVVLSMLDNMPNKYRDDFLVRLQAIEMH